LNATKPKGFRRRYTWLNLASSDRAFISAAAGYFLEEIFIGHSSHDYKSLRARPVSVATLRWANGCSGRCSSTCRSFLRDLAQELDAKGWLVVSGALFMWWAQAPFDNQAEAHDFDGWVTLVGPSALGPERALLFADLQEEKRREALEWDPAFVAATLRRSPFGVVEVLR
jgi:hypothetical protein